MFRRDVLLYVDDDEGFADLLKHTLAQGHFHHKLIHVTDGEQAIAYLQGEGKYADREVYPLPSVVLLDLKMPRKNGFEVLEWIRKQSPFPYLPVIVLTVSEELRDVNKAYQLGTNSFLVKPPKVADLRQVMQTIESYWMHLNVGGHSGRRFLS